MAARPANLGPCKFHPTRFCNNSSGYPYALSKRPVSVHFLRWDSRSMDLNLKRNCRARSNSDWAAVETKDRDESLYDVLGIAMDGSQTEIKQAYRQLALKYHPDVCHAHCDPATVEHNSRVFVRVQQAYDVLSDPVKRRLYDQFLLNPTSSSFSFDPKRSSQEQIPKEEWRSKWKSQLSELKRRSQIKNQQAPLSWAARVRQQNSETVTTDPEGFTEHK